MSAVRTGSLGRRLSLWLALQSLCGFMVVCAAVYMDARSNLADRQIEALAGKRAQIGHLVAESYGDDNLAGLKHKLDDLFVGHDEVSLSIRDPKGQALYTSESASSARGLQTRRTRASWSLPSTSRPKCRGLRQRRGRKGQRRQYRQRRVSCGFSEKHIAPAMALRRDRRKHRRALDNADPPLSVLNQAEGVNFKS